MKSLTYFILVIICTLCLMGCMKPEQQIRLGTFEEYGDGEAIEISEENKNKELYEKTKLSFIDDGEISEYELDKPQYSIFFDKPDESINELKVNFIVINNKIIYKIDGESTVYQLNEEDSKMIVSAFETVNFE